MAYVVKFVMDGETRFYDLNGPIKDFYKAAQFNSYHHAFVNLAKESWLEVADEIRIVRIDDPSEWTSEEILAREG